MKSQNGAILVVALVLLVLLGMMGTTSLRSVLFQEKVASSLHDQSLAFEAAEAGLTWCESFYDQLQMAYLTSDDTVAGIRIGDEISDSNDTGSLVVAAREASDNWFLDEAFWNATLEAGLEFSAGDILSALASNPHCVRERIVEEVPSDPTQEYFSHTYSGKDDVMADKSGNASRSGGIYHFRTTARGVGRGTSGGDDRALTSVVLQSDYFKRLE